MVFWVVMFTESPIPINVILAISHALFLKGDSYLEIDSATTAEASELYPNAEYTTVDAYLNLFV